MSIKMSSFWQPKNHPILLYDKKTRCRDVVCREGMLVQVGTRAALLGQLPAAFLVSCFYVGCVLLSRSCVLNVCTSLSELYYIHTLTTVQDTSVQA